MNGAFVVLDGVATVAILAWATSGRSEPLRLAFRQQYCLRVLPYPLPVIAVSAPLYSGIVALIGVAITVPPDSGRWLMLGSANYKQNSVDASVHGPRVAPLLTAGCGWCGDALFGSPGSQYAYKTKEDEAQRYWDTHPGGGWRSLGIFVASAIAAGSLAAVGDIALGTTSAGGLPPAAAMSGDACLAEPALCETSAAGGETLYDDAATVAERIPKITFSSSSGVDHGGRHLAGTILDQVDVEDAIRAAVRSAPTSWAAEPTQIIEVGGESVEFHAYQLPGNVINIGTYYVLRN